MPYNEQQHHLRSTVTDIPFKEVWVASQVVTEAGGIQHENIPFVDTGLYVQGFFRG
jgi:hypothetical protein